MSLWDVRGSGDMAVMASAAGELCSVSGAYAAPAS
jgi:hypothetical protein